MTPQQSAALDKWILEELQRDKWWYELYVRRHKPAPSWDEIEDIRLWDEQLKTGSPAEHSQ
jgi:hypothetical protein